MKEENQGARERYMSVADLEERSRSTRKVSDVNSVRSTPSDEVHVVLFGGVVVEVTAECVDVEDDEAVLASKRKDFTNQIGFDTLLSGPGLLA